MNLLGNRLKTLFISSLYFAFLMVQSSCIEEIGQFKGGVTPIIIDGSITTEEGPHTIKILRQLGFNQAPDYNEFQGANVQVIDDLGRIEQYEFTELGKFQSSSEFKAEVGRTYYVRVEVSDGIVYQSAEETVLPVSEIDQLRYEINGTQIDFFIDFDDEPNTINYYRWRFEGTYEVYSPLAGSYAGESPPRSLRTCYPIEYLQNIQSTCWLTDFDEEFLYVEDDYLYRDGRKENFNVYSLPVDRKLNYGYSALVKQLSLTEEAYVYWSALKNQQGNTGSIFETSNYQIVGNIHNISDPEELVLGYFGASDVSSARTFIEVFEQSFGDILCETNDAGCYPLRCVNCLSFGASARSEKPVYWPD